MQEELDGGETGLNGTLLFEYDDKNLFKVDP